MLQTSVHLISSRIKTVNEVIQALLTLYSAVLRLMSKSVSDLILNRKRNFLTKFVNICDNVVCGAISIMAKRELDCLK